MPYTAQDFKRLIGMPGFSEILLRNHFTLYEGYVKNVNTFSEKLAALRADGKTATPEYAELKRRFGWEFNGMRLHELYFGNMTPVATPKTANTEFQTAVAGEFGSWDRWLLDFKASGTMRGIGWVVFTLDAAAKRLFNVWINEHDLGVLVGTQPLLVLDVFEHAYMLDYGLKKADYLETFLRAVDWPVVSARFDEAIK
jgi:Fe-Mn family superoxide dismutase